MTLSTVEIGFRLRRTREIRSVVSTMKMLAAISIGHYERSLSAIDEYLRAVERGLGAALRGQLRVSGEPLWSRGILRNKERSSSAESDADRHLAAVVVVGSNQGLVGQFNRAIAEAASRVLRDAPRDCRLIVVGERMASLLEETRGLELTAQQRVPLATHVETLIDVVDEILEKVMAGDCDIASDRHVVLLFNRSDSAFRCSCETITLLPLDASWIDSLTQNEWPNATVPEVIGLQNDTLVDLLSEYLSAKIFESVVVSLLAESRMRLLTMRRAEKNLEEVESESSLLYHIGRQDGIDAEIFDLISGCMDTVSNSASKPISESTSDRPQRRHPPGSR